MSKREDFVKGIKEKLDSWNAQIDDLEAKVKGKGTAVQQKYEDKINYLKKKRDELNEIVNSKKADGEEAWNKVKSGIKESAGVLGDAISNAWNAFNKKD